MNEREDVSRIRVQWDCDGENLLMNIRDDGTATMDLDSPSFRLSRTAIHALKGTTAAEHVPGWGSELNVRIPLDPQVSSQSEAWDLAPRENEVLRLLVQGKRNREIAKILIISENTVKFHITQIYRKLGVNSRSAATAIAVSAGLK